MQNNSCKCRFSSVSLFGECRFYRFPLFPSISFSGRYLNLRCAFRSPGNIQGVRVCVLPTCGWQSLLSGTRHERTLFMHIVGSRPNFPFFSCMPFSACRCSYIQWERPAGIGSLPVFPRGKQSDSENSQRMALYGTRASREMAGESARHHRQSSKFLFVRSLIWRQRPLCLFS
jgi:hypothetical protein